MKKKFLYLILLFLYKISFCYALTNSNKGNNMKDTLQLVTIEEDNHDILLKSSTSVIFPLNSSQQKFISTLQKFFHNLKSPLGKPAGLAAPQVGYPFKIVIIQIPPEAKEKRKDVYDILSPTILINPVYTPILNAGQNKDWEGCFSVPNKMGEVYRYNEIHYEAYTLEGKKISAHAKGFLARLIQHEIDHLNGKLYTDYLCNDCRFVSISEASNIMKIEK